MEIWERAAELAFHILHSSLGGQEYEKQYGIKVASHGKL